MLYFDKKKFLYVNKWLRPVALFQWFNDRNAAAKTPVSQAALVADYNAVVEGSPLNVYVNFEQIINGIR
jgi:hypothetical protein